MRPRSVTPSFQRRVKDRIQEARVRQEVNGAYLADLLKIERTTYANLEAGKNAVSLEHAVMIFRELGIPLAELDAMLPPSTSNITRLLPEKSRKNNRLRFPQFFKSQEKPHD